MATPENKSNFFEYTIDVRRVVKVTTGGRVSTYSVLGQFGWGTGSALELFGAKKKAISRAKKNITKVNPRSGRTIPHSVSAKFGATTVIVRPASPGTGIVAGGTVRSLLEAIGLKDVVAKIIGSGNKYTTLLCVAKALGELRSLRAIANSRLKTIKDIIGSKETEVSSPNSE